MGYQPLVTTQILNLWWQETHETLQAFEFRRETKYEKDLIWSSQEPEAEAKPKSSKQPLSWFLTRN